MSIHTKKKIKQLFVYIFIFFNQHRHLPISKSKSVDFNFSVSVRFFFFTPLTFAHCYPWKNMKSIMHQMDVRDLNFPPHLWPLEGGKCFSTCAPVKTCPEFKMSKQTNRQGSTTCIQKKKEDHQAVKRFWFLILGLWWFNFIPRWPYIVPTSSPLMLIMFIKITGTGWVQQN